MNSTQEELLDQLLQKAKDTHDVDTLTQVIAELRDWLSKLENLKLNWETDED